MYKLLENGVLAVFVIWNVFTASFTSGLQDYSRHALGGEDYHGAMWFGPRLGKRSARLADDRQAAAAAAAWSRVLDAADALTYYYGQLADDAEIGPIVKKVPFASKLGRSAAERSYEGVNFTPRLGRQAADSRVTPSDQDNFRSAEGDGRPPLFAPRLGRRSVHLAPRLGRNVLFDLTIPEEESVRVARSAQAQPTPHSI